MGKYLTIEHFEKYLSSVTSKSFTVFSERLLQKLYPNEDIEINEPYKK